MILPVVQIGDPVLVQKSLPLTKGEDVKTLITDMFDTLYSEHGIGLAAVQVGVLKRLFIVDVPEISDPRVFINPVIEKYSHDLMEYEEGCLSIPGVKAEVTRSRSIELSYLDENFVKRKEVFSELLSVCIQHEIDHLDGILFLERIAKPEIRSIKKQLKKAGFSESDFSTIDFASKPLSSVQPIDHS